MTNEMLQEILKLYPNGYKIYLATNTVILPAREVAFNPEKKEIIIRFVPAS